MPARARRTAVAILHAQQLVALALEHLVDRHAGPARHHAGHHVRRHRLGHQHLAGLALDLGELLFQLGDDAVGQLAGALVLAAALGRGEIVAGGVELLLELLRVTELALLGLPALRQGDGLLLDVAELAAEALEPVLGGGVGLLLQRLLLDAQLHDAAIQLVQLLGLAVHLHAQARRRLVDEVDRLVGQETVGDVAVRQRGGGDDRGIGDADTVMHLVLLLEPAQDRDRVGDRRLRHEHRLEAPRQRRVLLDVLAVLVERGRADAMQLAARQRRLQQVGGVHRAVRLAGADERVHLVDKQHDAAGRRRHLGKDALQPLLELAAVLRAGDHGAHVEREQPLVLEAFGHVAVDDAQRETFRDRGLADAGLADQHGVVLCAPRQHLHGAADLLVAADHGIELALARGVGEVARILPQRVVGVLGRGVVGGAALAQVLDGAVQRLRRRAGIGDDLGSLGALVQGQRQQQPLHGDVAVAGLLSDLLGLVEHARRRRRQIGLAGVALHLGQLAQRQLGALQRVARASPRLVDEAGGEPLGIVEQHLQQVLGRELRVALAHGEALRALDESACALGVFLDVHSSSCPHPAPKRRRAS